MSEPALKTKNMKPPYPYCVKTVKLTDRFMSDLTRRDTLQKSVAASPYPVPTTVEESDTQPNSCTIDPMNTAVRTTYCASQPLSDSNHVFSFPFQFSVSEVFNIGKPRWICLSLYFILHIRWQSSRNMVCNVLSKSSQIGSCPGDASIIANPNGPYRRLAIVVSYEQPW